MIHLAGVMPNRSGDDERLLGRATGQKKIVAGREVVSGNQMRATAVSVLGRDEVGSGKGRLLDRAKNEESASVRACVRQLPKLDD